MSDALYVPPTGGALVSIHGRPLRTDLNPAFDPEDETRQQVVAELGPLDDIELFFNDVLVAKHVRGQVARGVLASHLTGLEDKWQGKIGLVLKVGPCAFKDDDTLKFYGLSVAPGDWVLFRNNDGWDLDIARLSAATREPIACRILPDALIRGRVRFPARIY